MIFKYKTDETKLIKIGPKFLEKVLEKGEEKSFKLVGIEINEDLSWKHHIAKMGKKVNSAIYGLSETYKHLATKNKKNTIRWSNPLTFNLQATNLGVC